MRGRQHAARKAKKLFVTPENRAVFFKKIEYNGNETVHRFASC